MNKINPGIASAMVLSTALQGAVVAALCWPALAISQGSETSAAMHFAQGAGKPGAAQKQPAGSDSRTRPAQTGPVGVNVLLLSDIPRNPDEYVEVGGMRYIYFNSPRLSSPARPLGEPKPRYPEGKITQRNGAVILQLLIDERGSMHRADVVCSAPPFEKSALESVKGLKFKPALGKDGPVRSYLLVAFSYGRGFPCANTPD
jgi:TonB family protein